MPIALINHAAAAAVASNNAITAGIDTTGATLLVIAVSSYSVVSAPTVSDSKGNTWLPLTQYSGGVCRIKLYYCVPGSNVGTGHTVTAASSGSYPSIGFMAFSGTINVSPFDQQNGTSTETAGTTQPGSITPTANNEVCVVASSDSGGTAGAINLSYIKTDYVAYATGNNFGLCVGYLVQGIAAATNPTLTITSGTSILSAIASFKAAAVAAVPNLPPALLFGLTA
jgi:hypothetical protein